MFCDTTSYPYLTTQLLKKSLGPQKTCWFCFCLAHAVGEIKKSGLGFSTEKKSPILLAFRLRFVFWGRRFDVNHRWNCDNAVWPDKGHKTGRTLGVFGVAASRICSSFSPWKLGRWTHFDEHIFQRGWNHQLGWVFGRDFVEVIETQIQRL